eukprot:CAMPEP_0204838036 /NCGR_PEP_ID=MMETSP1346-20131115/29638_1 /ASSEMBLY_ACC=CAM_ASM_000771 /TAXON_ID=215587 /ORGANISM="Aplanochytrium stocchinoi, Strain GSBS06" /LENGTH=508 /DNA_ID=CAMNT_0051973833 /DNA_START=336 /DNA_END=1859 /DNA_ORIENTATION=+
MFGAPSSSTSTSGGLFGSANTSTNTGGGLFGSSNTNSNTGDGLFGSSNTNANTGGGLFGSSNTNAGGGLFGSSNTNTNTGGGLFGSSNTNTNSGGLFGSSNTNTNSGGLFGSSNTNASTASGLFGSSNINAGTGGSTLFGSSNANASTGGGGLFGSSNITANTGGGLFGGSNTQTANMNVNVNMNSALQQQLINAANGPWWFRELLSIHAAYAPGQGNKFQSMMYEVVGVAPDLLCVPGAVAPAYIDHVKTQRKNMIFQQVPWIDQREWQKAEDSNPDPSNWMPTPVIGIDAMHDRVGSQSAHIRDQLAMLTESSNKPESKQQDKVAQGTENQSSLGNMNKNISFKESQLVVKSDVTNGDIKQGRNSWIGLESGDMFQEKIDHCRHEHTRLTRRLIKVMGRLERLICAGSRGKISQAETEFHSRLTKLQLSLDDPKGGKAQLDHLAMQLSMSDAYSRGNRQFGHRNANMTNGLFGLNQEEEQAVFNFLENQRDGLEQLMKIVKKDMRD